VIGDASLYFSSAGVENPDLGLDGMQPPMSDLERSVFDLVIANRILANEGVVDAYGHVSMRHPVDPERFLLSRSRSPELVDAADIMTFTLDGKVVGDDRRPPYLERFIHAGIYAARPDVTAVVHSHAEETLPYGLTDVALKPMMHVGGLLGPNMPVWDIAEKFGHETNLLVINNDQGRDLAARLGTGKVALMRGHGFAAAGITIQEAVRVSIYLPVNARVMTTALGLSAKITPLSPGEIERRRVYDPKASESWRAWEYWAGRAGVGNLLGDPP
jgi:HCOMODA/2-hydroxy-3-carboxy-muconic semialdehyde decarboxylase